MSDRAPCDELALALQRGDPLPPGLVDHVADCEACMRLHSSIGPVEALMVLAEEVAPADLRERIALTLSDSGDEQRGRISRRALVAGGAGVLAVAGAGAGIWWSRAPIREAEALLDLMIADHLEYRDAEDWLEVESADPATVERWLARRMSVAASLFDPEPGELLGARRCDLGGTPAGLVAYRLPDDRGHPQLASLYVLHAPRADFTHMRPLVAAGDKRVCRRHRVGLSAALWEERGLTYALVSELDDDELVRLLDSI